MKELTARKYTLTPEQKKAKKAYDMKYKERFIKKRVIDFNVGSEEDMKIMNHLDRQRNKSRYVKTLILDDMNKAGN